MTASAETTEWILRRLYEAAGDLGRLRRHLNPEPDTLLEWRLEQIAGHIETLIGAYEPTGGEIVACTHPGDDEATIAALEYVDNRHARLRQTLGYAKRAA